MSRREETPGPGARGQAVPWERSRPASRSWGVSLGRSHKAVAPELVCRGAPLRAMAQPVPSEAAGPFTAQRCAGHCCSSHTCLTLT